MLTSHPDGGAVRLSLSLFYLTFSSLLHGSLRTLLSIRDFMLKAAQTKWISRFVAKTSIQDALVQYDQQLRDAAMSFQVRLTAILKTIYLRTEIDCG